MQRTKHTSEFKAEAVKQVVDKGHTVVDVAARLGLGEGLLYSWVRQSKAADGTPTGDMRALQAELVKLKAALRRTTEERDILKKGRRVLCQTVRVKYAFMQAHQNEFRLTSMCRVLKVHQSGYYAWLREPMSPRAKANEKLTEQI